MFGNKVPEYAEIQNARSPNNINMCRRIILNLTVVLTLCGFEVVSYTCIIG